jgi:hypothetical protein
LKHYSYFISNILAKTQLLIGVLCLSLSQASFAQTEDNMSSATVMFTGEFFDDTCAPLVLSKLLKNTYVTNLPTLSSTLFLDNAFGPISKIEISLNTPLPSPQEEKCSRLGPNFLPVKLVFDSDLAAIAPRTGLLRNSASLRPAQNVFVQLGLLDAAGVFSPLDLNKPQALNTALAQQNDIFGASQTLTLGIRYVASRSYLAQNTNLGAPNAGSQDVTAGNVSIFLPFLLKLN